MKIRAHHLLCLLGFQGLGYSPDFVRRMAGVRKSLERGPVFPLTVTESCDDICCYCPYCRESKCAKGRLSFRRTRELDRKVLNALGLEKNQRISSGKALPLVRERINSFGRLVKICGRCGWREVCTYYVGLRDRDIPQTGAKP